VKWKIGRVTVLLLTLIGLMVTLTPSAELVVNATEGIDNPVVPNGKLKVEKEIKNAKEAEKRIRALKLLQKAKGFKSIPKPLRKVIFEDSKFLDYITLWLPKEDSRTAPESIKGSDPGLLGLLPLHLDASARKIDARVTELFYKYNLINIEEFVLRTRSMKQKYTFLYYSEKLLPYICKGNFKSDFSIKLASRVLKSIDSKNENRATGIYTVNFSYKYDKEFPYYEEIQMILPTKMPPLNKTYKGAASLYSDPNDGLWKLEQLTLDPYTN